MPLMRETYADWLTQALERATLTKTDDTESSLYAPVPKSKNLTWTLQYWMMSIMAAR